MNFDIKYFIEILIIGTANHLSVLDLKLNRKQKNLLRISLNVELEKDFRLQTKTPTELVNKFINDEFELEISGQLDQRLTPIKTVRTSRY